MPVRSIGDEVLIGAFGDRPAVCKVYDFNEKAVFACPEPLYREIMSGEKKAPSIGYRSADVYIYDRMQDLGNEDWRKIKHYP